MKRHQRFGNAYCGEISCIENIGVDSVICCCCLFSAIHGRGACPARRSSSSRCCFSKSVRLGIIANQVGRNSVASVPNIYTLFAGARRFPGLINCTSVDFFHPWPRQALISVAARFLEDVELGDPSVKESLALHMAEEHLSVTKVGWVPVLTTKRLALLSSFVCRSSV